MGITKWRHNIENYRTIFSLSNQSCQLLSVHDTVHCIACKCFQDKRFLISCSSFVGLGSLLFKWNSNCHKIWIIINFSDCIFCSWSFCLIWHKSVCCSMYLTTKKGSWMFCSEYSAELSLKFEWTFFLTWTIITSNEMSWFYFWIVWCTIGYYPLIFLYRQQTSTLEQNF